MTLIPHSKRTTLAKETLNEQGDSVKDQSKSSKQRQVEERPKDDTILLTYAALTANGMQTAYLKQESDDKILLHYTATGILVPRSSGPPAVVPRSIRTFFLYSEVDLHRINAVMM